MIIIVVVLTLLITNILCDIYYGEYSFRQLFCLHNYKLAIHDEYWKNKIHECAKCAKLKDEWY